MRLDRVSTLDKIIRIGWKIQAWCDTCKVVHRFSEAELVALAEKVGPDYSLINRRCRCRLTPGCRGWNRFDFQAGVFRPLSTEEGRLQQSERDQGR